MTEEALDPEQTTYELRAASRALAAAAAKLGKLNKEFQGPGREFELKVLVRKVGLYNEAVARQEKPAGEDARQSIADVEVRTEFPALAAEYDRLTAERVALKDFISAQRQVISGHQSVLSAAKVLTGFSS